MKGQIIGFGLVIIIAIFAGVMLTIQQTTNPVLQKVAAQQAQMMEVQKGMAVQLDGLSRHLGQPVQAPAAAADLNAKTTGLEQKVDKLSALLDKLTNPQQQAQRQAPPTEDMNKVYDISIDHSPVKGKKDAPVTITVFGDFQCPFSARFQPILDEVIAAYPDKVNYVLKHFPLGFHPMAMPASKAAFAANEQGKYWEMVKALLDNARSLSNEKFEELAKALGLKVDKFKQDLEQKGAEYEKWIKADMEQAARVDVRGTPTFYMNGKKTMARTLDAFKQEIDKILQEKTK